MKEIHVGYLLKKITDKLKTKVDAELKQHNLTLSQNHVLIFLDERGGESTQKEIENFLEVTHPTVVGLVSRMEQNGFLTSWIDPKDRRNKIVKMTEKASNLMKQIKTEAAIHEEEILSSLSEEQRKELKEMLSIIYQNIDS